MTDKTHQLIGITAATAFYLTQHTDQLLTWPIAGSVLAGAILGSVAPDLDQPTANLWDEIPLGKLIGRITSRCLGGHRNLSHSLLGIALFTGLAYWLSRFIPTHWWIDRPTLLMSFIIGFVAHLAADAITVMGIPLLWPFGGNMGFPPRPFEGIRIITGKWFENLIVLPVAFLVLLALIWANTVQFCPLLPFLCQ